MAIDEVFYKKRDENVYRHKISGVPGFEGALFTKAYKAEFDGNHDIRLEYALQFTRDTKSTLPSVREAAAYAIASSNPLARQRLDPEDTDIDNIHTRTCVLYFKDGGKTYLAIDDSPIPAKNLILSRLHEGDFQEREVIPEIIQYPHPWSLPKNDRDVSALLKRAEKSDRIVRQPKQDGKLLALTSSAEHSAFERNPIVRALLGDMTQPYADMLKDNAAEDAPGRTKNNYIIAYLFANSKDLYGVPRNHVLVKCASISLIDVYANRSCIAFGRARGIYNPTEWRPAAKR